MIDIAQYVAYDIPMTGTCPLSCSKETYDNPQEEILFILKFVNR